jgi:hypothetical protein
MRGRRHGAAAGTVSGKGSLRRSGGSILGGRLVGVAIIQSAGVRAGLDAGTAARGEFRCADCGYGISVRRTLPTCPMCRSDEWLPWAGRRTPDASDTADLQA